jgi:hypothetical protein
MSLIEKLQSGAVVVNCNGKQSAVNDNPPVFDRPTYETQITEEDDRNLPKRVLQVMIDTFVDQLA